MPNAPQYVSVAPPRVKFSPGNGLPDVPNTGVLVSVQATLDALTAAATLSGISLSYSAAAPSNYAGVATSSGLSAAAQSLLASSQAVGNSFNMRALRRFHAALGDRNANPCDIFVAAGDSLMSSYQGSTYAKRFDQRLLTAIRTRYPQTPVGGIGMLSAAAAGSAVASPYPDAPQAGTPSGVYTTTVGQPGWSLDSTTALLTSAAKNRSWTFTGTGLDFVFLSAVSAGGTFTVTVDGTNYGTYNAGTGALTAGAGNMTATTTAGTVVQSIARIRGLAAAAHTVNIVWASGSVFIGNAFAYNGDETTGVRMACAAFPGMGTRAFVGNAANFGQNITAPYPGDGVTLGNQTEQWLNVIYRGWYLPDLVLIDNFANDFSAVSTGFQITTSENLSNLTSIIAKIKSATAAGCAAVGATSYVPSFVLIPPQVIATTTTLDVWQNYVANAYSIAANDPDNSVCVFDLGQRLQGSSNTYDNSLYQGLLASDKTHFSDAGNDWLANSILDFIKA